MNKSKDSNIIYSISLSIILLAGVFFQVQLQPITFSQFAYGKDYNFVKEAGANVNITTTGSSLAGKNVSIDWDQFRGPEVNLSLSNLNQTATFTAPVLPNAVEMAFNVTTSNGKVSKSDNLIFTILADKPPVANAGTDRNISIQEICNSNNNYPSVSPIILDGSQSRDDHQESLKYEWSQIAGEPIINLTSPNNVTSSFQLDNICNLSSTVTSIFNLVVTDSKNQTDDDNVMIILDNSNSDLPEITFQA